MRLSVCLFLSVTALAALSTSAFAKTIKVDPDPGQTPIADAVAQLADGDKLILNAGTYDERIILADLSKVKVIGKGDVMIDGAGPAASISVTDCEKIRIQGLKIMNAPTQGILILRSTKVAVKKCVIENQSTQAVQIGASEKVSVQKCTITGGSVGVELNGEASANISGNTMTGQSSHGVFAFSMTLPGTRISKNDISNSGRYGIELDGPGNKADKNTVTDCMFGIHTQFNGGDMAGSSIVKNRVTNALVALRTYATGGVLFAKNTVVNATASVMQIASAAEDVVVSRNRGTGMTGFDDEGTRSTLSRNTAADTMTYGFRARGMGGTFDRNVANDTPGFGFEIWAAGNTFTKNKATGNATFDLQSVRVAEGDSTFVKNKFGTTNF